MVTKYDVFMNLYDRGGSRKIIDVLKDLQQKKLDYDKIRKILETLVEMKLIHKNKSGYERIMNSKNQHLFEMMKYCIQNGVNYNDLFNETLAQYLHKAFLKKYFTENISYNLGPAEKKGIRIGRSGFFQTNFLLLQFMKS